MRLRADVLESVLLMNAGMQYMQAMAALHAHPEADFSKAGDLVNTMYFNAMAVIPYMTDGLTGKEIVEGERMKAVEKFMEMRRATIKTLTPKSPEKGK